jgi:hypothetical protein
VPFAARSHSLIVLFVSPLCCVSVVRNQRRGSGERAVQNGTRQAEPWRRWMARTRRRRTWQRRRRRWGKRQRRRGRTVLPSPPLKLLSPHARWSGQTFWQTRMLSLLSRRERQHTAWAGLCCCNPAAYERTLTPCICIVLLRSLTSQCASSDCSHSALGFCRAPARPPGFCTSHGREDRALNNVHWNHFMIDSSVVQSLQTDASSDSIAGKKKRHGGRKKKKQQDGRTSFRMRVRSVPCG